MLKHANKHIEIFNKIPMDSKICIYGSNDVAEKIYDYILKNRPDVQVKFFADTKKSGELKGLPLYLGKDLILHNKEVDGVVVASFSARYYIELILQQMGYKNIYLLTKSDFEKFVPSKKRKWDINKSAQIFKTYKERELYKFIANARADRKNNLSKINVLFNKNYPERYAGSTIAKQHYFEYINKEVIKCVIDGGGFDGLTSIAFSQEFKNVQMIYMFEPCYNSFKTELNDTVIKLNNKIKIIDKGLWDRETTLEFREETEHTLGSSIVEAKPGVERPSKIISIQVTDIDSFVEKENIKIDFIKLDVENAEMNVLKGAEKTILRDRPQMAISIYHSDEQFYGIPLYLKEILQDYDFRFAHYSGDYTESVLYAIPKELITKRWG